MIQQAKLRTQSLVHPRKQCATLATPLYAPVSVTSSSTNKTKSNTGTTVDYYSTSQITTHSTPIANLSMSSEEPNTKPEEETKPEETKPEEEESTAQFEPVVSKRVHNPIRSFLF